MVIPVNATFVKSTKARAWRGARRKVVRVWKRIFGGERVEDRVGRDGGYSVRGEDVR
jgi:hypothetical protein